MRIMQEWLLLHEAELFTEGVVGSRAFSCPLPEEQVGGALLGRGPAYPSSCSQLVTKEV